MRYNKVAQLKDGWGVDPASVRIEPMRSAVLREAWGQRYSVYMRRRLDATPTRLKQAEAKFLQLAPDYYHRSLAT